MVLPSFVNQALEGKPLTVYGSGRQSRCFCYVTEAVEAVIRLVTGGNALGEVVNIGNDQETTIEGLAELVKERIPSPSQIEHIPYERPMTMVSRTCSGERPAWTSWSGSPDTGPRCLSPISLTKWHRISREDAVSSTPSLPWRGRRLNQSLPANPRIYLKRL